MKNSTKTKLLLKIIVLNFLILLIISCNRSENQSTKVAQQPQAEVEKVMELLQIVAQFEQMIVEIKESYVETIRLTNVEFEKLKDRQVQSYLEGKPRAPWETQKEFEERIKKFEEPLKEENKQEIATIERQRDAEIAELTKQMDRYKKDLSSQEFTIEVGMVDVDVLSFNAAEKYFSIQIRSQLASLPFTTTVHYHIYATNYDAMSVEYARIEDAVNAGALVATIHYSVEETFPLFWELTVNRIAVYSLLESDQPSNELLLNFPSVSLKQGNMKEYRLVSEGKVRKGYAFVPIKTFPAEDPIRVDGIKIGVGKATYIVTSRDIKDILVSAIDNAGMKYQRDVVINKGMNSPVPLFNGKVGDLGPAGGYVFYDKGSYSDGWRYLEAAPSGWGGKAEDPRYEFGEYRASLIETSTAIGSGKVNTQNIVQKLSNKTHAAKVATDYKAIVDGVVYDDWFLPSIDELELMHKNLHVKNLGGFSDSDYWSSSIINPYYAFLQGFNSVILGGANSIYARAFRVRPVRSF